MRTNFLARAAVFVLQVSYMEVDLTAVEALLQQNLASTAPTAVGQQDEQQHNDKAAAASAAARAAIRRKLRRSGRALTEVVPAAVSVASGGGDSSSAAAAQLLCELAAGAADGDLKAQALAQESSDGEGVRRAAGQGSTSDSSSSGNGSSSSCSGGGSSRGAATAASATPLCISVSSRGGCSFIALHACGTLTDVVLGIAVSLRGPVAVMVRPRVVGWDRG